MSQPAPEQLPPVFHQPPRPRRDRTGVWLGVVLLVAGAYFLLRNLGYLEWLSWELVWPVVLIAAGAWLVVRRLR